MTRTIVELDLIGYSDLARHLEENLSVKELALLDKQIQGFVDAGLKAVNLPRVAAVLSTAGDNAYVIFDQAGQAHRFALAVHEAAGKHNASKTVESARRWFRIGAATGEISIRNKRGKPTVAGITIANAVRLEAAAKPGEFLVDTATFQALPPSLRRKYGPEETVQGKRKEQFQAHRCVMLKGAPAPEPPQNAISGSTDSPKPPTRKAQAPKPQRSTRQRQSSSKPQGGGVTMNIGKVTGQVVGKQVIKGDQIFDFSRTRKDK